MKDSRANPTPSIISVGGGAVLSFCVALTFLGNCLCAEDVKRASVAQSGSAKNEASARLSPQSMPKFSAPIRDYEIRPLDILEVRVFQEDDLCGTNKVSQTGQITLPLIGNLRVAGLKLSQLEETLALRYRDGYLKNPQISVTVKEYAARKISVLGEVKKPGFVEFPPEQGLTLLQAIAQAGGFQNVAKTDAVVVRRMVGGQETKISINATDLMKAESTKEDFILEPNDVVYVPTRFF